MRDDGPLSEQVWNARVGNHSGLPSPQLWSETLLNHAANAGHVDTIEFLLSRRADVAVASTHEGKEHMQALHVASEIGHLAVLEVLIRHGASVHAKSKTE